MDILEKAFKDYFSYLPQHITKWNNSVDDVMPYLKALKNQSEQYRVVRSKKWNDDKLLKIFPDIENRLLEKIILGIEQESIELRKLQSVLASLNKDLFRKHDAITKSFQKELALQFTSEGTVLPPVWHLIELAENAKHYYALLFLQLELALCSLKYEDQNTITDLEAVILDLLKISDEIKDILAYTDFFRI